MTRDYETVLFETDGHVATVTLNRPAAMNAFNQAMVDEFRQLWGRETAQSIGWHYTRIGNPLGKAQVSREAVAKPKWTLR